MREVQEGQFCGIYVEPGFRHPNLGAWVADQVNIRLVSPVFMRFWDRSNYYVVQNFAVSSNLPSDLDLVPGIRPKSGSGHRFSGTGPDLGRTPGTWSQFDGKFRLSAKFWTI